MGKVEKATVKERGCVIENKKKNVTQACVPGVHQSGTIPRNDLSTSGTETEMEISHWESNEQ